MSELDLISQVVITLFGGTAIFLLGLKPDCKWRRYGYICGLISQPFWYITAIINQQWAMTPVFLFYTYSWINGFKNYWIGGDMK